jgi:hypothetical protein
MPPNNPVNKQSPDNRCLKCKYYDRTPSCYYCAACLLYEVEDMYLMANNKIFKVSKLNFFDILPLSPLYNPKSKEIN